MNVKKKQFKQVHLINTGVSRLLEGNGGCTLINLTG